MRRRSVLRGFLVGSVVASSGCTSVIDSRHGSKANDVTVESERDSTVFFDVIVIAPDGGTASSTRHEVPPEGTRVLEDIVDYGEYDLTIAVDGLPSASHDWSASGCRHLTVEITAETVQFIESVC